MKYYGGSSENRKYQICHAIPDKYGGANLTNAFSVTLNYECIDPQVTCRGVSLARGDEFNSFMNRQVSSRLNDTEGTTEFESHLRGLQTTGFGKTNIEKILATEESETRGWAIGESIAEAYLEREEDVVWPWNKSRDILASKASLPGADLIGFVGEGEEIRLVIGEVKTSSRSETPPNVMYGRSGMTRQIGNLAEILELIHLVTKWLYFRCKGTKYEVMYDIACARFANSGNRDISLFGVLLRDTEPNELDLKSRRETLAAILQNPTICQLIAIYLPCKIEDLVTHVSGGGS